MEVAIMANTITGVGSGQPVYQPQKVTAPKQAPKEEIPQPKADVVTISSKGKQAAQLIASGSSPAEEAKESPVAKAVETQAGKK
jgi:hypothetical protein